MSRPFPLRTRLGLSLILKATKRAPQKPPFLTDLKDAAPQVDADYEYDIIIVGGGEFPVTSM